MNGHTIMLKIGMGICLLFSLLLFNGCSSSFSEKGSPGAGSTIEKQELSVAATYSVEIKQMQFIPAELKVKKGDKITFINHDIVVHDITDGSKKAWSSSPLATNQRWVLTAVESANYYCSIHPMMKGKIIVE